MLDFQNSNTYSKNSRLKNNNFILIFTSIFFVLGFLGMSIAFILVIQLIAGTIAYNRDLIEPFSLSKKTARYIQEQQWDTLPIIGIPNERVCVLSGYLDKKFYYPQSDRLGSFVIWDNQRTHINEEDFVESGRKLKSIKHNIWKYVNKVTRFNKTRVLLISIWSIEWEISGLKISKVKQFAQETIGRENNYQLYIIEKKA